MRVNRFSFLSLLIVLSMVLAACGGGAATQNPTQPATGALVTDTPAGGLGTGAATETPAGAAVVTDTPAAAGGAATETPAAAGGVATETLAATATTSGSTGGTTGGTTGVTVGGAPITLPAECTNVALTYWNPFTGPDGPFMGQMVDAYNASQKNVVVTMNSQADYYTQLSTAAASGTLPDVAIVHADQLATQAFRNVIRPIDEVAAKLGVTEADFPPAVWQAGIIAGKRYSVPLDIHPMTMYYNADLLKAAGIDKAPTTLAEFEAAAKAMTKSGENGFMITTGFPVQQIFQMLLHQYGGNEFSADGTKITWNSDAGVKALTWMQTAQKNYSQPNLEVDAELNAFKGGTVGMIWNGIWQFTNVTGDSVGFKGQASSVPQIGDQMAVWAGSHQFTLPVQAKVDPCKDAAAGQFIQYLLQNSVTWSKAGQIPASNAVRASQEFKDLHPQSDIATTIDKTFFPPSVPGITDALAPLNEAVAAVLAGTSTDIKKALDDSAQRAQQILDENKNTFGTEPGAKK